MYVKHKLINMIRIEQDTANTTCKYTNNSVIKIRNFIEMRKAGFLGRLILEADIKAYLKAADYSEVDERVW